MAGRRFYKYTPKDIEAEKLNIDGMPMEGMVKLWMDGLPEHPFFREPPVFEHFRARFEMLTGFTLDLSKRPVANERRKAADAASAASAKPAPEAPPSPAAGAP